MAVSTPNPLQNAKKILRAVDKDHALAIVSVEVSKPILFDQDYLDRFQDTYSSHVVNYLQHAIHNDGVMILCRLWDNSDGALSIPNLLKELRRPEVVAAIKGKRKSALFNILNGAEIKRMIAEHGEAIRNSIKQKAEKDWEKAEDRIVSSLAAIQAMNDDTILKDLRQKIRNWRDKHIAHPLENTRTEIKLAKDGVNIAPPKWDDSEKLLAITSKIVAQLLFLVDEVSVDPRPKCEIWKTYSRSFWKSINQKPR